MKCPTANSQELATHDELLRTLFLTLLVSVSTILQMCKRYKIGKPDLENVSLHLTVDYIGIKGIIGTCDIDRLPRLGAQIMAVAHTPKRLAIQKVALVVGMRMHICF